jgi:SAM-dependent methyltransferase
VSDPGMDPARARALNLARWEGLAAAHGQDDYYDSDALVDGADSLAPEEAALAGDVTGLDVLHVQCHIGFDAISLARRGARVTGVDFSPGALAKAAALAQRCGVAVEWVQGDATALPESLSGRFDLAYATIGVICWIDDLRPWMSSVFGTLRPGGRLVLLDGHPMGMMVDTVDPLVLDFPYANDAPFVYDFDSSYAQGAPKLKPGAAVNYAHSLAEVVTSAVGAGFHVDGMDELRESHIEFPPGRAVREPDGLWRLRVAGQLWPMLFSLRASRPD